MTLKEYLYHGYKNILYFYVMYIYVYVNCICMFICTYIAEKFPFLEFFA